MLQCYSIFNCLILDFYLSHVRSASFIGSQTQQNAKGAVGSIVNMECKTKGSCKGAAKIRGNSAQTQNIKAGGKGTLSNSGKRRKRSPSFIGKQTIVNEDRATSSVKDCKDGKCQESKLGKVSSKLQADSSVVVMLLSNVYETCIFYQ